MKVWLVEIEESTSKVIEVVAPSKEEAKQIALTSHEEFNPIEEHEDCRILRCNEKALG